MAHLRQFLARIAGLQSLEGPPHSGPMMQDDMRSDSELCRGKIVGESDFDEARHERGR
jgi:hypothetical protein